MPAIDDPDSSPPARPSIPIWVISLRAASARRAFIAQGFADAGLEYVEFDAVDGARLGDRDLTRTSQSRALFDTGRMLTRGEVGCALSHLRVYERMLEENIPVLLVMEDDARPSADLTSLLEAMGDLPADWDVVTLLSQFPSSRPVPIDEQRIAGDHQVCRYEKQPFGAQCYLITSSAARRLLEVGYPIRLPADELLFRRRPARLNFYGIEPAVAFAGDLESELAARGSVPNTGSRSTSLSSRVVVVAGKAYRRLASAFDRLTGRR
jgi:glycosyl transferase family 25